MIDLDVDADSAWVQFGRWRHNCWGQAADDVNQGPGPAPGTSIMGRKSSTKIEQRRSAHDQPSWARPSPQRISHGRAVVRSAR
jgi:hypothetical protein